ncbi:MAG: hypothetical protein JRH20_31685 [Deltaproteobacteria bacterium]|nr:hypothetical protein [Deltaproteobacteria bacterium]
MKDGFLLQRFSVPINAPVTASRYYWRAVSHSTPYVIQGGSGGPVLISSASPSNGECPPETTALAMSAASHPLPLSMTVMR